MFMEFLSQKVFAPALKWAVHLHLQTNIFDVGIVQSSFPDGFPTMWTLNGTEVAIGVMRLLVANDGRGLAAPFQITARARPVFTVNHMFVLFAKGERFRATG